MPALSPTMSQGNIAQWQVKEGQEVAAGDVLADIETDKATMAWENQDEGFIAKILKPSGSKDIAVGTPCAILVEEEDKVTAFKDYKGEDGGEQKAEASAGDAAPAQTGKQQQQEPEQQQSHAVSNRIGPAAKRLLEFHGLSPADIKSPSGPHGIITKGDVLEAVAAGVKPGKGKGQQPSQPKQQPPQQKQPPTETSEPQVPAAGAHAQQLQQPRPSSAVGEQQAGSKAEQQMTEQYHQPGCRSKGPRYTDIPNSQIRKIIAQRLLQSKQSIPHVYVSANAELRVVNELRQALKEQGQKVSVNDFIIKATAVALQEVPRANAYWDAQKEEPVQCEGVDIAVAVATDAGLITPIVTKANTKSLTQISAEVRELASRARANKLKPHEFQGGSFSISNLGMYGVDRFNAIINPPQACIMAVGGSRQHVKLQNGEPAAVPEMTVTLSADERVYDGETSGLFLEAFCKAISNPIKLLS